MGNKTANQQHQASPRAKKAGATIIDLSINPNNFSPAINHIVTSIQEARATDQRVIVMLGEEHSTISHVALPLMLRRGLAEAGSKDKPALVLEQSENLLEYYLPDIMRKTSGSYDTARHALNNLKQNTPNRYHHLQALTVMSLQWPTTPVTHMECVADWLREKLPVRLIDIPINTSGQIDLSNPEAAEFVKKHTEREDISLSAEYLTGRMRLRNLWEVANLSRIINENDLVLCQMGLTHIAGEQERNLPYKHSLHGLGIQTDHNVKIITVFPEIDYGNQTFTTKLSQHAQKAMNTPDTVIIRGGNGTRHKQGTAGSIDEEIKTLHEIFMASGQSDNSLSFDKSDYEHQYKDATSTLYRDLTRLTRREGKSFNSPLRYNL